MRLPSLVLQIKLVAASVLVVLCACLVSLYFTAEVCVNLDALLTVVSQINYSLS